MNFFKNAVTNMFEISKFVYMNWVFEEKINIKELNKYLLVVCPKSLGQDGSQ